MLSLRPHSNETIIGISRDIAARQLSCVNLLDRCLAHVDDHDAELRAWVVVDRDDAHRQAQSLDAELASTGPRGALHGIPIGVKDIIDVRGLPTAAGFEPWRNRIANEDAPIVAALRAAGAVIVGKTVTTQFACFDPPRTRNPWHKDRTPGGSSSGSAVAVATGMCLAALGTQTGGSITRPASYCGVCGLKPTHGALPMTGIVPVSATLDHVGPMARCVDDLHVLWRAMSGRPDNVLDGPTAKGPPTICIVNDFFRERAADTMRDAFDGTVRRLAACGAILTQVNWSPPWAAMLGTHRVIMVGEGAQAHGAHLDQSPAAILPGMRSLIEEGRTISPCDYQDALSLRHQLRTEVEHAFEPGQVWMTPATPSAAPDTTTTGDPSFNAPWSLLGLPTLSLPVALTPDGLPLAIQLIAGGDQESALFTAAKWVEAALRSGT